MNEKDKKEFYEKIGSKIDKYYQLIQDEWNCMGENDIDAQDTLEWIEAKKEEWEKKITETVESESVKEYSDDTRVWVTQQLADYIVQHERKEISTFELINRILEMIEDFSNE